jgi:hypothetical protein
MLDIFRGLVYRQPVTPRNVQVEVGTPASTTQTADSITAALSKAGFDSDTQVSTVKGGVTAKSATTVVRYGTRGRVAAALLARWLDANVTFSFDAQLPGARLLLSPGTDYKGVRTTALPESAVKVPSLAESATTTTTLPGSSKSRSTSTTTTVPDDSSSTTIPTTGTTAPANTTTTTVIGVVPVGTDASAKCT